MVRDREMNLNGQDALALIHMLTEVDFEAVSQRDDFISDVTAEMDADGTLVIECPDLDLESVSAETDTYMVSGEKDGVYVGNISVVYAYGCAMFAIPVGNQYVGYKVENPGNKMKGYMYSGSQAYTIVSAS